MHSIDLLYHVALQSEFNSQLPYYEPTHFLSNGSIQCGSLAQLGLLISALATSESCVLLEIDPGEVDTEIRWEYDANDNQTYARVYGPIPLQAIQSAMPIEPEVEVTVNQLADLNLEEAKRLLSNDE